MHEQEQDIFRDALAIRGDDARRAYLDTACAGDAALRRRVEILLHAHEGARRFLERPILEGLAPTPADGTAFLPPASSAGDLGDPDDEDDPLDFLARSERADARGRLAHYEVLEVLGRGGFGTVVRAFDEKLHRMVAIKVMARALAATSPPRKRFLREARAAAAVRHPHVVAIHAVDEAPVPYLVMEFVAGPTLQAKLDRSGPIEPSEVVRIGLQIAEGLAAAHRQGLVHRDIKPANILLEDAAERVKITDFGLARAADDASLTQSGVIAGTPLYMAPEQALGEAIDARSDLFSLGSVLYVMATGRPPFRAATTMAVLRRVADEPARPIREIIPEVPAALCDLIENLHAKDPADRPASADEVAARLRALHDDLRGPRGHHRIANPTPGRAEIPVEFDSEFCPRPRRLKGTTARRRNPTRPATTWGQVGLAVVLCLLALIIAILGIRLERGRVRRANIPATPSITPPPVVAKESSSDWGSLIDPTGPTRIEKDWRGLTITVPGGARRHLNPLPGFNLDAPRLLRDVTGDFSIRVTQLPSTRPGASDVASDRPEVDGYQWAGLVVWLDERHFLRFGVGALPAFDHGRPFLDLKFHRDGAMADEVVRYTDDRPMHLRIDRRGDALIVWTSPDGQIWTNVRTCSIAGDPARLRVGVAAINCGLHEYQTRLEAFSVVTPTPTVTPGGSVARSTARFLGVWGWLVDPLGRTEAHAIPNGLTLRLPEGMPCDLNPTPGFRTDAPRTLSPVEGDFRFRVKLLPFAPPGRGTGPDHGDRAERWAGALVWIDETNFSRFGVARSAVGHDGRPVTSLEVFQNAARLGEGLWPADETPIHLEVERQGSALTFRTGRDGLTWTNRKTFDLPALPRRLQVGVAAVNTGTREFAPTFEELILESRTPEQP